MQTDVWDLQWKKGCECSYWRCLQLLRIYRGELLAQCGNGSGDYQSQSTLHPVSTAKSIGGKCFWLSQMLSNKNDHRLTDGADTCGGGGSCLLIWLYHKEWSGMLDNGPVTLTKVGKLTVLWGSSVMDDNNENHCLTGTWPCLVESRLTSVAITQLPGCQFPPSSWKQWFLHDPNGVFANLSSQSCSWLKLAAIKHRLLSKSPLSSLFGYPISFH